MLRYCCAFVLVVIATALVTPPAHAVHTAFWVPRPISAAAVADDPALTSMQSFSLMVNYDVGRWASAGVRATLPAGNHFYQHPQGGDTVPNPTLVELFPGLAFDTYVTAPDQVFTVVLGGYPASPPPASFGGPNDPIPGTFSVSWGRSMGGTPITGTFEIARLTFPIGVFPHIQQGPPETSQSISYTVVPDQKAFVGQVPEPAGAAALALCAAVATLRRRRT